MGVSINGGSPKSSILMDLSIVNQPFWEFPIYGKPQVAMTNLYISGLWVRLLLDFIVNSPVPCLKLLAAQREVSAVPQVEAPRLTSTIQSDAGCLGVVMNTRD